MGRYSKVYSNYVLREKHQNTSLGEIFERDFSTIGERHNIAPGKKRFYFDGNMLFTINNTNFPQNKENNGSWVCSYMYPDVKNIVTDINNVKVNSKSNNICDFCYFGSAFDIIRASVEDIIETFPASIVSQQNTLATTMSKDLNNESYEELIDDEYKYMMFNPFGIDFINQSPILGEYDNELRHFPISWNKYVINFNDNGNKWVEPIIGYDFDSVFYTGCIWDESYQRIGTIKLKTRQINNEPRFIELHAYLINGETILTTKETVKFEIKPNENEVNNFFNNLDNFEKQLLNRESKPLYTNNFITPIQRDNGWYKYPLRTYTWPLISGSDYCIDISSNTYEDYIYSLTDLANTLDEIKCDNIWRNMTHESIKNFDWTYTRAINEEMEEEFFEGGERMKSVLRLIGRTFDDVKHNVDGIAMSSNIDYSNFNIAPDAEMSDKTEIQGWDILTTSWTDCNNAHPSCYEKPMLSNMYLGGTCWDGKTNAPLIEKINPWADKNPKYVHSTWYKGRNYENLDSNNIDVEFMKRLYLSSRRIFQTKGTEQGIEMILGMFGFERDTDYKMYQRSHSLKPIPLNETYYFYEKVPYDDKQDYGTPLNELPIFGLNSKSNEYIEVRKNEDSEYYHLNGDYTTKELVDEAITNKMEGHYYENDGYLGVPLSNYYFYNKEYLIPYYSDKEFYDGDFYFQSKGGWGKRSISNRNDYLETLSYVKVFKNITDMLSQDGFELEEDMICYVSDYSDYLLYSNVLPNDISHYFKLVNALTYDEFNSWKYIPMEGDIVNVVNYVNEDGITHDDYLHAKYLDSIKTTDFGNNPHVGYGKYDMGQEYLDYMKKPFKFIVDEGDFYTPEDYDKANSLRFDIKDIENDDKIKVLTQPYKLITDENLIDELQKETFEESNYSKIEFKDLPTDVQNDFLKNSDYHTFERINLNVENSGFNYIRIRKPEYRKILIDYPNYSYEDYQVNTEWVKVTDEYIKDINGDSYEYVEVKKDDSFLPIKNIATFGFKDEDFVELYPNMEKPNRYKENGKYYIRIYGELYHKNIYNGYVDENGNFVNIQDEDGNDIIEFYQRDKVKNLYVDYMPSVFNENSPKYIKLVNTTFDGKAIQEEYYGIDDTYYLNDKLLVIENLNQVDVYKEYFMNYISHYLMQMIPSTTLLVFKNFNLGRDENKKVTITTSSENGSIIGGGTYNIGDSILLNAIPNPDYNFQCWTKNPKTENIIIPNNNIFVYVTKNDEYVATFSKGFKIDAVPYNSSMGSVSGGGEYDPNTVKKVTLVATPKKGYNFVKWVQGDYDRNVDYKGGRTIIVPLDQSYILGKNGFIAIFEKDERKSVNYITNVLPELMKENISVLIKNNEDEGYKKSELNGKVYIGSEISFINNNDIITDKDWKFNGWYRGNGIFNSPYTFTVENEENIEITAKYTAQKNITIIKKVVILDEKGKPIPIKEEDYNYCKIRTSQDICNFKEEITATAITTSSRFEFLHWDNEKNPNLTKKYKVIVDYGVDTFIITAYFKKKEEKNINFHFDKKVANLYFYNFTNNYLEHIEPETNYELYRLLDDGFTEVITKESLMYLDNNYPNPNFEMKGQLQFFINGIPNSYGRLNLKQVFDTNNDIEININEMFKTVTFESYSGEDLYISLHNAKDKEDKNKIPVEIGKPFTLPIDPYWEKYNNYFMLDKQDPKIKLELIDNNNIYEIPNGKIAYSDLVSDTIIIRIKKDE